MPYVEPIYKKTAYNCPYCSVFSNFDYYNILVEQRVLEMDNKNKLKLSDNIKKVIINNSKCSICNHCHGLIIWVDSKMIYPSLPSVYEPNEDLNEDIKNLFNEANSIYIHSPRAACALLRLCLEKLCIQLNCDKNKKINENIQILIERERLSKTIQQMLDYVRVIGNSAVHPNVIDESDKIETAQTLFDLINMLAYQLLTVPREIDEKYTQHIPESIRNSIEKRKS